MTSNAGTPEAGEVPAETAATERFHAAATPPAAIASSPAIEPLPATGPDATPDDNAVDERSLVALYAGENADVYVRTYDRMAASRYGVLTWSWPALLVPLAWLPYRRLWVPTAWFIFLPLAMFYLTDVKSGIVAVLVAFATQAKQIYVWQAQKRIARIVAVESDPQTIRRKVVEASGVSGTGLLIGSVATIVVALGVTAIVLQGASPDDIRSVDLVERLQKLTAATAPALLLGALFFVLGHRTLPPDMRGLGLVAGTFAPLAVVPFSLSAELLIPSRGFPGAYQAFIHAALVEETAKFGFLMLMVLRHFEADVRRDAILAGVWVGLGFGAIENVTYLLADEYRWAAMGVSRAVTAVPFHAALGAIMGWLVHRTGGSPGWWPLAIGVPIALHGSYNWGVFVIDDPFAITGLSAEGGLTLFSITLAVTALFLVGPIAHSLRALNRGNPTLPYKPFPEWAVPAANIVAIVLVLMAIASIAVGVNGWRPLWKSVSLMIPASALPLAFAILWWRAHPPYVRRVIVIPGN